MNRLCLFAVACMLAALLIGCGGPEEAMTPTPPDDGGAALQQVGPLLVRPAAAAGFVAQEIPNPDGPVSFVALHGSRITYLASQALLDRIVFSRGTGSDYDLCVSNLDGSNAVRILDNPHRDARPRWSPDGTEVAFDRTPSGGGDTEIVVANANGTGAHALTANTTSDFHPTWSPNGDEIAFEHRPPAAQGEIYVMYSDGSGQRNLTNNAAHDASPDWSQNPDSRIIVFHTTRDGNPEIYRMGTDGQNATRLTDSSSASAEPALRSDGYQVIYEETVAAQADLWLTEATSLTVPRHLVSGPGAQQSPVWSTDDRYVCFTSDADGDPELMLREMTEPFRTYALTSNGVSDVTPDLGSPVMQTDRVIIGPAGSDWGGYNPIWSNSDAGIAAYDVKGYRNFVRLGIPAAQLPTLSVTPLASTAINGGGAPVGVVVEAADIVNLREDGGRGQTPVLWQLDPLNATEVLLYFDGYTGKLLSVLVLRDQNYPAGAGAPAGAVTERAEGGATVVEGAFAAVFDGTGARVADAASAVRIAAGEVSVLR